MSATPPRETRIWMRPSAPALLPQAAERSALPFHRRLPGYSPTPLVEARLLARQLGVAQVLVKNESSRFGLPAYKILGAAWAVYRAVEAYAGRVFGIELEPWEAIEELRERLRAVAPCTLVCATDGNHGRAVARIARLFGLGARVFVPRDMTEARRAAIVAEGATVTVVAGSYDDAVRQAAAVADEQTLVISDTAWDGYTDIPGWVMDGYRTMFTEVSAQLAFRGKGEPDVVIAQIGVGSLAAAVVRYYWPLGARVIGVEPIGAACVFASLKAGHSVSLAGELQTIMNGLNCGTPSLLALPELEAGLDALVAIPDSRAADAVRMFAQSGIASGESGAAGLGGLLELFTSTLGGKARAALQLSAQSRVLLFVTEGPTDPERYALILAGRNPTLLVQNQTKMKAVLGTASETIRES